MRRTLFAIVVLAVCWCFIGGTSAFARTIVGDSAMNVNVKQMPGGDTGTFITVEAARKLVNDSIARPLVRQSAVDIVRWTEPRDYAGVARTLRSYLVDRIRFLRDPNGAELLHEPELMLTWIRTYGVANVDCDDAAILSAALGKSVGLQARFVLVGFRDPERNRSPFAHIWTELAPPSANLNWRAKPATAPWIEMDVTRGSQYLPWALIARTATVRV